MIYISAVVIGFVIGIIFYRYSQKIRSLVGPVAMMVTGVLGIAFHNLVAFREYFMTVSMVVGYAMVPLAICVAILGFKERKSRGLAAAFDVMSAIAALYFAPNLIFALFV